MKKYEYKLLQSIPDSPKDFSIEDVNEHGKKGWRVVEYLIRDDGYEAVLLERETTNYV